VRRRFGLYELNMLFQILLNFVKLLLVRFSELFVAFNHTPLSLRVRNSLLIVAGVSIGKGVDIDRDFDFMLNGDQISVGDYSVIGIRNHFWNYSQITIGRYCMTAADVTLTNGGHDKETFEPFSGPLLIGNGCWIGNGARIVGPLSVGDNAIVAAGAVVVEDVPTCAIVAGVPAKIIGYRALPDKVWHLGNTWFSPHTFETVK